MAAGPDLGHDNGDQTAATLSAPPAPDLAPVAGGERIASIDTLRGLAVLGILAMNITAYATHFADYMNPLLSAPLQRTDFVVYSLNHLVFDFKMMTIFSMLFGAGVVVQTVRADAAPHGTSQAAVHFRRMGLLLCFGLIHAYLMWFGDILVSYAILGMPLFFARRLQPRVLLVIALSLLLVGVLINIGMGVGLGVFQQAARTDPALAEQWKQTMEGMRPTPEQRAEVAKAVLAGYPQYVAYNAREALFVHMMALPLFMIWRVGSAMLIGMALMRWGVFSASRSPAFYIRMALVGYTAGLSLVAIGLAINIEHEFELIWFQTAASNFNYVGSFGVALGHVALVMLACQAAKAAHDRGFIAFVCRRLADAGRMALTNYISQTVICVTLFAGFGLGLYGSLSRLEMAGVVLAVWIFQLLLSWWWFRRFRIGPLEWLWRTLTYLRAPRMR